MIWLLASLALAGEHVLAVVPFDSATADEEMTALSQGLATMMVTDLGESPDVTMVERSRVEELISELEFQHSAYADPATAQKIGRIVGATALVTGQVSQVGGTARIDARVIDVATGKVLASTEQEGKAGAALDLERRVALGVLEGLGAQLTDAHRKRLGFDGETSPVPDIAPGSGFDDAGPTLHVYRKGFMMRSGSLWVDGVKIEDLLPQLPGMPGAKKTTVALKRGKHEVMLSDWAGVMLECSGVIDVQRNLKWDTDTLCNNVRFDPSAFGEYGSARRGGLLEVMAAGNGVSASISGPTNASGVYGLLSVAPGTYSVSVEHQEPSFDGPGRVTPICTLMVDVEPGRVTRVAAGQGGCAEKD